MIWYIELVCEAALLLWLAFNRDCRPRFEAWIWSDFLSQLAQLLTYKHYGWQSLQTLRIWYLGVIIGVPLMALALNEAHRIEICYHRTIMHWWVAITFGCAWVRTIPNLGRIILAVNSAAFLAWLWCAVRYRKTTEA